MFNHTYSLRTTLEVPLAPEHVFAVFSDARNLERITPPELSFRILTPLPLVMEPGLVIEYSIRLWFMRMRWRSLISLWLPPRAFTDVQVAGPYAFWEHRHLFRETPSGTRIIDEVRYRLPFGILGRLAHPLVRAQLRRIFLYRQEAVSRLLLGDALGAAAVPGEVSLV